MDAGACELKANLSSTKEDGGSSKKPFGKEEQGEIFNFIERKCFLVKM